MVLRWILLSLVYTTARDFRATRATGGLPKEYLVGNTTITLWTKIQSASGVSKVSVLVLPCYCSARSFILSVSSWWDLSVLWMFSQVFLVFSGCSLSLFSHYVLWVFSECFLTVLTEVETYLCCGSEGCDLTFIYKLLSKFVSLFFVTYMRVINYLG